MLQWYCHMIIYRPSLVQISLVYFMDRWTNPPSKISSKLMTTLTCLKSSIAALILFASLESLKLNQGRMWASNSALQPYNLTTLQFNKLQHYNLTTLQSHNLTILHPYNLTTLQPYKQKDKKKKKEKKKKRKKEKKDKRAKGQIGKK